MLRRGWFTVCTGVALLTAAVAAVATFTTSRAVPSFYRQAVQQDRRQVVAKARQLEKQFDQLQQDWKQREDWQLVLTAEQMNAWLTSEAARPLAKILPKEASDPRVALDGKYVKLACRYDTNGASMVLWMGLEPYLSDDGKVLGVRIADTRAGWFPVSPDRVIEPITRAAHLWNLKLEWKLDEDKPVALIEIPSSFEQWGSEILVESISIDGQEVLVRGTYRPQPSLSTADASSTASGEKQNVQR